MLDLARYGGAGAQSIRASLEEAAAAGSLEATINKVRSAWRARFPENAIDRPLISWVFPDHVIVDDTEGEYQRHSWAEGEGGGITFGDAERVEMIFQPASEAAQASEAEATWGLELAEAEWSTAMINRLPDSAFLYVAPGGRKDNDGKTVPRSLRYFPVRDGAGKPDRAHVTNALARAPQAKLPGNIIQRVIAKARSLLKELGGTPSKESDRPGRRFWEETRPLEEAPRDGRLPITAIVPGFNSSRSRYYQPAALAQAVEAGLFEGVKMYADHPTKAEASARPERSVRDWVATLENSRIGPDGEVQGDAVIIDQDMEDKVRLLASRGRLGDLGTSIRGVGDCRPREIEGHKTLEVGALVGLRSVDFVTEPGAGGRPITEAEEEEFDLDVVDLERVQERRPDLVGEVRRLVLEEVGHAAMELGIDGDRLTAALEGKAEPKREGKMDNKELEEAQAALREATEAKEAAEKRAADLEAAARRRQHGQVIELVLVEAKVAPAICERVRARFAEAETVEAENVRKAIREEKDYIRSVTGAGKPKGLGESDTEGAGAPDAGKGEEALTEALQGLGLTEDAAKAAAAV